MPIRVLQLIESSETGGAEAVFAELCARLAPPQHSVTAAVLYEGWLVDHLRSRGIAPVLVPTRAGGLDVPLLRGIRRLVRDHRIDLVHAHLFTTSVYAGAACIGLGVPVVATFHGTMDVDAGDWAKRLKWAALNRTATRTVFVSAALRDHFLRQGLARQDRSIVIHNGIDLARFRAGDRQRARDRLGLPHDSFVIGCVGDLRPSKDYATMLAAVSRLPTTGRQVRTVVAGTHTALLPELIAQRDALGLGATVEFIGHRSDVAELLPAFDIYLTTSVSEGFSLTVVEALATGLPVVATRSGGPEEILEDGVTGVLVPPGDAARIAEAVQAIRTQPTTAARLAAAGTAAARQRFSIETMLAAYETLYAELLT